MRRMGWVVAVVSALAGGAWSQSLQHTPGPGWDLAIMSDGRVGRDSTGRGGTWPTQEDSIRTASYLSGLGLWFGCTRASDPSLYLIEVTYAPFRPGDFTPLRVGGTPEGVYASADYNSDGTPRAAGGPLWPIRNLDTSAIRTHGNAGAYVRDSAARAAHPAAFLADQDFVAAFSDSAHTSVPYPIGLRGVLTGYVWTHDSLRDVAIFRAQFTNTSNDTLRNCYLAPMADFAVGDSGNDYCEPLRYDTLPALYAYSAAEPNGPYGYAGLAMLNGQRGARLNRADIWGDYLDPMDDRQAYQFMDTLHSTASGTFYATVRGLLSTGPFTLLPGKTAECIFSLSVGLNPAHDSSSDTSLMTLTAHLRAASHYWLGFNTPSGVEERVAPMSELVQLYPDPMRTTGIVTLDRPLGVADVPAVFDALGRLVPDVARVRDPHHVALDASRLRAGVYGLGVPGRALARFAVVK